ncbi:hypothetical protein [Candidatus Nitrotoga sp. HW29]|uniref:hypothetical protein n=1 Tax=Candidatus Nitrotoga sp. HW29 TaxID=2886963 RepID=UPI001EF38AFE|nr:hypothetical protein [Candidatus Nitrotoga sp. HW29]
MQFKAGITEEQVLRAVERFNHQPRKVPSFRSLYGVFLGVEVRYIKQSPAIALQT